MKDLVSSFVFFMLLSLIYFGSSTVAYSVPKLSSEDHYVAYQKRAYKQKNKAVSSDTPEISSSVELVEELEEEQNDEDLDLDYGNKLQNFQENKELYNDENSSKFYIER